MTVLVDKFGSGSSAELPWSPSLRGLDFVDCQLGQESDDRCMACGHLEQDMSVLSREVDAATLHSNGRFVNGIPSI
jgi:hypothetical protein